MFKSVRTNRCSSEEAEISLTPLIDMVFILLIFFLVTASFLAQTGVPIDRPAAATAAATEADVLTVGLDSDGRVYMGGRQVDMFTLRQAAAERSLGEASLQAVLVADRRTSAESIVKLMDELRKAGLERIALAAEKNDE